MNSHCKYIFSDTLLNEAEYFTYNYAEQLDRLSEVEEVS